MRSVPGRGRRAVIPIALALALALGPAAAPDVVPDVTADTPVFTGPPGSYTLTAPGPVRLSHPTATSILLDWSPPPEPPPGPTPPPIPTPGPTPAKGTLHVTAVFDTAAMTPAAAKVRGSITIKPAMRALDAIWRTYELASPELDQFNLRATVQATGTPALIVQGPDGKLVRALKLTTEADALNLIKALR